MVSFGWDIRCSSDASENTLLEVRKRPFSLKKSLGGGEGGVGEQQEQEER